MTVVKRFSQNTDGTDYIVGDIHGCFDQLQALVEACSIDPVHDRLFAVGDLIDRGPHSLDALRWMEKPWFHACLGNHEDMLLSSDNPLSFLNWMNNGGEWWLQQDEPTREEFQLTISQLPLAMEIESPWGCVGIVHADVPKDMSWSQFIQALESGDDRTRWIAIWGRARADGQVSVGVNGVDRVVCGHTIMFSKEIKTVANVWFIDTGAYMRELGGKLSMIQLRELFREPVPGQKTRG